MKYRFPVFLVVSLFTFGLGWYLGRRSVRPAVVTKYDTLRIMAYDTVEVTRFVRQVDTIKDTILDVKYIVNHDTVYISSQNSLQFLSYCEVKPGMMRGEWVLVDTTGVSRLSSAFSKTLFGVGGFTRDGVVHSTPYFLGFAGKVQLGDIASASAGVYIGHKNWIFMGLITNDLASRDIGVTVEAIKLFSPVLEF